MHRRQKLTIGGVTKWVSFSSTQELVDLVTEIVRAEVLSDIQEKKLFGDYLKEWYEVYHHPNPTKDKRIVMPTAKKKREGLSTDTLTVAIDILPTLPEEYSRILAMLMMTGCGRGKALGARWEDVD